MQKFFIYITSALEFYKNARTNMDLDLENSDPTKNTLTLRPCSKQPSSDLLTTKNSIIIEDLPYCGNAPFHLLTKNKNYNRHLKNIKFHYSNLTYLRNSFLKYNDNIYIPAPPLLFYQLATIMPFEQLLQTGLEMCGTYSISESAVNGYVYNIPPLTTALKIKTYITNLNKRHKNLPCIRKALQASSLLIDNCASPQESNLYIKLCAPRNMGGYEISNLKANCQIKLSEQAREILKHPTIKPDLCNKKTKIAIEYDSNEFHDNTGQNTKDKLRADALQHDG